jgi:hypothetical protein
MGSSTGMFRLRRMVILFFVCKLLLWKEKRAILLSLRLTGFLQSHRRQFYIETLQKRCHG